MTENVNSENQESRLKSQFIELDDKPKDTKCLLCNSNFVLPTNEKEFLTHIFKEHRLVIGDVKEIASLKSYVNYWRVKFRDEPLEKFCTTFLGDCTPNGEPSKNENYFLLSNCIAEDKILRDELRREKLEWILGEQLREKIDKNFQRGCMFCRTEFTESRHLYVKHLSEKHNIQLGKMENLVLIDELLDKIQNKIESLICIYCEKQFKDRAVLKEHMRKKLHKRINPGNKSYDKFYINNYLEPRSTWRQKQSQIEETEEPSGFSSDNDEENWSDWNSENVDINCLFCDYMKNDFKNILNHMKVEHDFNFELITSNCNFYQKVKIVNYARKQMHVKKCLFCDCHYQQLNEHLIKENHFKLPAKEIWDQPEFYFPMYENDSFLYNLDSNCNEDEDSSSEICQ
ncbi:zinc finger protein 277 [Leptopilina boulardi]|uniref:zinc finger protein 277 n=1 Tax=Leptopilina boulardi TaxID=63433 RepID=UPI0021F68B48|nr:zinc finger protein 277 [Leptopilina boulardi]XP_051174354.1 zinc finger protein 277 [Leptopilina boulardi]